MEEECITKTKVEETLEEIDKEGQEVASEETIVKTTECNRITIWEEETISQTIIIYSLNSNWISTNSKLKILLIK